MIIQRNLADPWWKGLPSPRVIYARDDVFERAIEKVRSAPSPDAIATRVTSTNYAGLWP
jgi:hypothetical protein